MSRSARSAGSKSRTCRAISDADRAAGAGDEHALASQELANRREVGLDLLPPEQVLDPQVAQVAGGDAAADDLADRRQHPQRHARLLAQAGDVADQVAGGARDRQEHLIGVELARRAPGSTRAPRARVTP